MKSAIIAIVATIAAGVSAQSGLPVCAVNCASPVLATAGCGLDPQCICNNAAFIASLGCCVKNTCSPADQATTATYAANICGPLGVTLPSSAVCTTGASSTTAPASSASSGSSTTAGVATTGSVASSTASTGSTGSTASTASTGSVASTGSTASTASTASAASTASTASAASASAASSTPTSGAMAHFGNGMGAAAGAAVAALAFL